MTASVYEVVQQSNDARYVGLTTRDVNLRWRAHVTQAARKPKGRLQRAIRQCGEQDFEVTVRAELPTQEEAQIAERILIALEHPALNALAGGEHISRAGAKHTESSRAAIGEANRGKIVSAETRAKQSVNAQARPEHIAKLIVGNIGRKQTPEHIAKVVATKVGKPRSAETKAKIAAAMVGNTNRKKLTASTTTTQETRT